MYPGGRQVSERQVLEIMRGQFDVERESFMPHWRDLNDLISPRRMRFGLDDVNRGDRRSRSIIDGSATFALRTLRSGMMSGVTSPARQWFRLSTTDPDLTEFGPVKDWLYLASTRLSTVFLKSNLYNTLPVTYGDMGGFATGALLVEEDEDDILRSYPIPVGTYYIGNNDKLRVDTFMREFQMTVKQVIQKFGKTKDGSGAIDWSNISTHVQSLWETGHEQSYVRICHAIIPNPEYNPRSFESRFKKFKSVYYERGMAGGTSSGDYMSGEESDKFLRRSGYDFFPVLAPRWEVTGEDTWGTSCPGMDALGDIRQLQHGEKRSAQAIDKMVDPPMQGPTSLRAVRRSTLPGDITYVDDRGGNNSFRPSQEVRFDISALENKQGQIRQRISRAFFEDLFLMLSQSDRREITAREIDERHEEKLLALGPVLEQLNQDLLDPLIDVAFNLCTKRNLFPTPPKEIQGGDLKIEYISLMAQAQKMIGIGSIERFMGFAGQVAAFKPEALDKIDVDQALDLYGDILSVPPGIIRSDDKVKKLRDERAQAQAQAAQAERIPAMAGAAKDLSQSGLEGDNALTRIANAAQSGSVAQA